jgi:Na+-translocating ferredoxin:NAD+ oxidoreductase RnfG subunit
MKINYLKIECLFFSVFVGLTFGVMLAVVSCISVFIKTLVTFPTEFYNIRMQSHLQKQLDALIEMPDDIWGRHVQRMDQNKKEKNNGEL